MSATANCPTCGAAVTFARDGSLVVVCEYCRSVVARTDRDVASLGQVAAIVETDSPLKRGLRGRYAGAAFVIAGRIQVRHTAGGTWDEWLVSFDDGRWMWLAEAMGRFFVTTRSDASTPLPPAAKLRAGATGKLPGIETRLVVREVGEAEYAAAEGELPFRLTPGEKYRYADFAGANGEFATIDYSDETPVLFSGREVKLEELGIAAADMVPKAKPRVSTTATSCPNCGGPLSLRAPDKTQRVTCPNCNSQLDVDHGRLTFLKSLTHSAKPKIPLGTKAKLHGVTWEVIGFMQRSTVIDGTRYPWDEYLLYNVQHGFRWLVCSDGHWNFVEPVEGISEGLGVTFGGRSYRHFQHGIGQVDYVLGEFYWRVEVGEPVVMDDYVAAPNMLSREMSESDTASEVSWSLGTYLTPREVSAATGLNIPDERIGVGPNQPFIYEDVYRYWAFALTALLMIGAALFIISPRKKVAEFRVDPPTTQQTNPTVTAFSPQFELSGTHNLQIHVRSAVDNSWTYVEGDVYEAKSGATSSFAVPVEYYHGYDDGNWSEGSQDKSAFLSSLAPGRYTMRAEVQWPSTNEAKSVYVTIRSGVPRFLHFLLALIAISILPICVGFYHATFEQKRWENSSLTETTTSLFDAEDDDGEDD